MHTMIYSSEPEHIPGSTPHATVISLSRNRFVTPSTLGGCRALTIDLVMRARAEYERRDSTNRQLTFN